MTVIEIEYREVTTPWGVLRVTCEPYALAFNICVKDINILDNECTLTMKIMILDSFQLQPGPITRDCTEMWNIVAVIHHTLWLKDQYVTVVVLSSYRVPNR